MNSRQHLAEDLERLIQRSKAVGVVAWAVAVVVMVYGTPIVFEFLIGHQVPGAIAWLLSLAADGALIVGLIATPVLAELGEPAGWVGTLRWVAGFITWALQTAGSWTAKHGPDMVGVLAHSAGPVLLFFAVEAASSFQRKVAAKLTEKTRELEAAEQRDADRRAHLAELEATVTARTAELTAARSEINRLTGQLTAEAEKTDKLTAGQALTDKQWQTKLDTLNEALTAEKKGRADDRARLTAEREDALREANRKYREKLAEAKTTNLADWRNRGTGKAPGTSTGNPVLSDESAVQQMLEAHDDPAFEWSKNAVRTLTGVGLNRAEKLIGLWLTAATEKAAGEAVNQ